jgi:hypothetical protein
MKPLAFTKVTAISVLAFALGGCARDEPQAKERKTVVSPSGRLQAKIAVLDLGPAMRLQQVYITQSGTSVKLTGRDTAGMIAATVYECQDENFDARWISDNKLAVTFSQDKPGWVNYVSHVQGVMIVMEDRGR